MKSQFSVISGLNICSNTCSLYGHNGHIWYVFTCTSRGNIFFLSNTCILYPRRAKPHLLLVELLCKGVVCLFFCFDDCPPFFMAFPSRIIYLYPGYSWNFLEKEDPDFELQPALRCTVLLWVSRTLEAWYWVTSAGHCSFCKEGNVDEGIICQPAPRQILGRFLNDLSNRRK